MFFNLYLSEFIRIKYTLITSIIIILMAQILTTFLVKYSVHDHSILVGIVYGLNKFIGFIYVIITPMYYMKQYMKNKEYFISYPLSNIQKYLAILAITFTMIIILLALEVLESLLFDSKSHTLESFKFLISHFTQENTSFIVYVGAMVDLCIVFFLINMASFKWFMIVFIIGITFYLLISPMVLVSFLPTHVISHTVATGFLLFFALLTLLFIGTGYFRVATLQSSSNRYVLQYFIILVIGLVVSPVISGVITRLFLV